MDRVPVNHLRRALLLSLRQARYPFSSTRRTTRRRRLRCLCRDRDLWHIVGEYLTLVNSCIRSSPLDKQISSENPSRHIQTFQIESGGPPRSRRASRHLQTPQIESGGPQGSPRASRHLQAPQIESGGPPGSRRDPKGAGEAPLGATAKRCFFHPLSGDNRETVFLSPPEVPFR